MYPTDGSLMKVLAFLVAIATPLSLFPGVENNSPTIEVLYPDYSYSKPLTSIRELDLRESDVLIFAPGGKTWVKARLHGGLYDVRHKLSSDWVRFNWLRLSAHGAADPEVGVAYFDWVSTGASASDYGVVQVLRIRDGHLNVGQQMVFNTRGSSKAGASFSAKTNVLTVRGVHGWEHCCPTDLDVVQFRFEGELLRQVHYRREPLQ